MNSGSSAVAREAVVRRYFGEKLSLRGWGVLAFWLFTWLATGWVLLSSARQGADFQRYECWRDALVSGDIFQMYSLVASPLGLPLSVHSAGPGMLLSVGIAWFDWLGLPVRSDYLFMGLAGLCAWWALLRLTLRLTEGNVPATALVLGLGFVGTHLGYYSGAYSSELASFFALGILFYFALGTEQITIFEALLIGTTSGLAIIVRTQLAMYVALPFAVAVWRVYRTHGLTARTVVLALVAAVPCLILLVDAAFVNRWMTGSLLRTPYQFGDDQWQSVDFRRPEFGAVLGNPRHGLLVYHPLYAIGLACVVYLLATARDWSERAIAGAAIAITLMHWYLQAAWFCWWLGTGTFGMRGMLTTALLLLPAIALVLDRRQRAGQAIWPLIVACLGAAGWSLLLYFKGESNFDSWAAIFKSQRQTLLQPLVLAPTLAAAATGFASWLIWRRGPARGLAVLGGAAVGLAISAAAHAAVKRAFHDHRDWLQAGAGWGWAAVVAAVTAGACGVIVLYPRARATMRASEILIGGFVLAFAVSAGFQFQRLVRRTETHIRDRAPSPRLFVISSPVLWDEIEASYEEYKLIPGFEEPKQRFWAYLERHNDDWAFVRLRRQPRRKKAKPQ